MLLFVITTLAMAALMLLMAAGVLLAGRRLRGSCGGGSECNCARIGGRVPRGCPRRASGTQLAHPTSKQIECLPLPRSGG